MNNNFIREFACTVSKRSKFLIRMFLSHAVLYVRARPKLTKVVLGIINRFPLLKQRMKRSGIGNAIPQRIRRAPVEIAELTPRARHIYSHLKVAISRIKELH